MVVKGKNIKNLIHPVKCHFVAISPNAKLFNRVNSRNPAPFLHIFSLYALRSLAIYLSKINFGRYSLCL